MNKYDVFKKVKKVIDSCVTDEHCVVAQSMTFNFSKTYQDYDLEEDLHNEIYIKRLEIIKNYVDKEDDSVNIES